jgi:tripartite-type tricarboxylate transporter receptor subunit TctC
MMSWKSGLRRVERCVWLIAAMLVAASAPVAAQSWPTQTIRLVVPFPAGGSNDVMGRLLAPHLEKALGQTVLVDNRPAAAGQVGTEAVGRAAPDGHTLLLVASSHTVRPAVAKLPYDTEKDFAPVSLVNTNAMFFFVHPDVPAKDLKEFVELARKNPGKFDYASPGAGSQTHLTVELLALRTGIKLQHVPYRGGAPATQAMVAGETQFTMLAPNVLFPLIADGKIRPIANGAPQRHPRAPDVPTTAELGFPNIRAIQWVGVLTTAGTPRPVIDRLNKEINRIIHLPDVVKVLEKQGVTPTGSTPEEFQALITREIGEWTEVAKAANIKLN